MKNGYLGFNQFVGQNLRSNLIFLYNAVFAFLYSICCPRECPSSGNISINFYVYFYIFAFLYSICCPRECPSSGNISIYFYIYFYICFYIFAFLYSICCPRECPSSGRQTPLIVRFPLSPLPLANQDTFPH